MNEEKHKELISILSESLPKPPPEERLELPPSLAARIQETAQPKPRRSLFQAITAWLRSTQFTYAASAAILVFGLILLLRPANTSNPAEYGLRGTESPSHPAFQIVTIQGTGPVWEEFKTLTNSAEIIDLQSASELTNFLGELDSTCIVVSYENALVSKFVPGQQNPVQEAPLPETGIELLELIGNWQQ